MRSAIRFVAPREIEVVSEPVPEPGPEEVLVSTRVSAISPGTELLLYRGEAPTDLDLDETIPALAGGLDYPFRYGYAAVGDVVELGDDVDPAWLDRTVFAFNPHESHFLASPADLHPLPPGMSSDRATLLPSVETAVTLAHDAAPRLGERVAVFGEGLVGLLTTSLLSSFPLGRLLAVDPLPRRRELATEMGADEALVPEACLRRYGQGSAESTDGFDLSVEISGNPAALDDAVAVTGYDGRIVVGSWYGTKRASIDLGGRFHRARIAIESSQVSTIAPHLRGRWSTARRLSLAWDVLADVDEDGLLTDRLPVSEAPEAYRRLDEAPGNSIGALLTYD